MLTNRITNIHEEQHRWRAVDEDHFTTYNTVLITLMGLALHKKKLPHPRSWFTGWILSLSICLYNNIILKIIFATIQNIWLDTIIMKRKYVASINFFIIEYRIRHSFIISHKYLANLLFHLLKRYIYIYDCMYQNSIDHLHKTSDSIISIDEVKKWTPKFHELRRLSGIILKKWKILIIMLQTMEVLIEHDYFKIYGNILLLWYN